MNPHERFDVLLAFATLTVIVVVALVGLVWQLICGAARCAWQALGGSHD